MLEILMGFTATGMCALRMGMPKTSEDRERYYITDVIIVPE
jgi:hypothetical protein